MSSCTTKIDTVPCSPDQVRLKLPSIGEQYLYYSGCNQVMQANYLLIIPLMYMLFHRKLLRYSWFVELVLLLRKLIINFIWNDVM